MPREDYAPKVFVRTIGRGESLDIAGIGLIEFLTHRPTKVRITVPAQARVTVHPPDEGPDVIPIAG